MKHHQTIVNTMFPDDSPVMIAYDNINIHRGRARYTRLKAKTIPIMWNFTGKIAIKPNIEDIKHTFEDKISSLQPQKMLKDVKVSDTLLGIIQRILPHCDVQLQYRLSPMF